MNTTNNSEAWDAEYRSGGIPSSIRDDPSGVLLWTISNWQYLTGYDRPRHVMDVGCGTGRNSIHMAGLGIFVMGFDISVAAIKVAQQRATELAAAHRASFSVHDLSGGLPASDGAIDLITDIFVYKHQLDPRTRAAYRAEMRRVLKPEGKVLISFAELTDGYYGGCPTYEPPGIDTAGNPYTIVDTPILIGSVLFRIEDMIREMSDTFRLEMSWHKEKIGTMHGDRYLRKTVASIWSKSR